MVQKNYFVLDFDSTFTQVEALDVLCEITQEGSSTQWEVINEIQKIRKQ